MIEHASRKAASELREAESHRIQALDSTRIFAASAVVYAHAADAPAMLGRLGVEYFFALSGYLITGILLRARGTGSRDFARPLGNFFARRCLRIWPAYYLLLAFLLWRNHEHIRDSAIWHILYSSNVLFWLKDRWNPWIASHFWSLAVEEQFYLIWPFLIYWTKRAVLKWLLPALAFASWGMAFALSTCFPGHYNVGFDVLMPFSLLSLAMGATLAVWRLECPRALRGLKPLGYLCIVTLIISIAIQGTAALESFGTRPLTTICFVWFIAVLSTQTSGTLSRLLAARPLVYLGSVSYGVYLYHLLMLYYIVQSKHGPQLPLGLVTFIATWTASVLLACLSWHLIEKPANAFKARFVF